MIESVSSSAFLVVFLAGLFVPGVSWLVWVALAIMLTGFAWAHHASTPADRERKRQASWIIPLMTLLVGAQWVFLASGDGRPRAILIGAGLVAAGAGVWLARRRVR
jgi:hypothetical protein